MKSNDTSNDEAGSAEVSENLEIFDEAACSTVPIISDVMAELDENGWAAAQAEVPLCVDLDGTLVKSDTLVDAILLLLRQQPASALSWAGWMRQGKAAFKQQIAARARVDVEHLPWNGPLLAYLREEFARGRRVFLATAADRLLADQVAGYLGIFEGVLASDGTLNLAGGNKLTAFQQRFPAGFTYIGNAMPDRTLLKASVAPMVANPHRALRAGLRSDGTVIAQTFEDRKSTVRVALKAVRLHQWAKNILVFLPTILAHDFGANALVASGIAFLSLSFCASATYVINDLLDIEADRRHSRKRRRPFAAGDLSPIAGAGIVVAFFAVAFVLALLVPRAFAALPGTDGLAFPLAHPDQFLVWLGLYTVTTLAYSFRLKQMMLVDTIVLSGLYTVRILAGSAATGVTVSTWLAAFSIFFFLSLAFVKRFSELDLLAASNKTKASGRGYGTGDMEQLRSFGTASAFASVVVLTMYISNLDAANLYLHSTRLWLLVPVLLLWIMRVWLLASRGHLHEDPVVYAITDKRSWLLGLVAAAIIWAAL